MVMTMRHWFVSAVTCGWPLWANATTPIPTVASFQVSAVVTVGCLVVGNPTQVSGVNFGVLDFGAHSAVSATPVTASLTGGSGQVAQLQCTPGAAVTVTLDGGQNASGPQRRLRSGASHYLPYTLYTSAAKTTAYPPGVGVPMDTSTGAVSLTVHGVATPPGSGLPAGQYSDTVQVTFGW